MDGRGVPLSLVVTGANEHDVTQLDQVLSAIMVKRKMPSTRRSKHLCADAGYRGRPTLAIINSHGYIPHVVNRSKEAAAKRRNAWLSSCCIAGLKRPAASEASLRCECQRLVFHVVASDGPTR